MVVVSGSLDAPGSSDCHYCPKYLKQIGHCTIVLPALLGSRSAAARLSNIHLPAFTCLVWASTPRSYHLSVWDKQRV